MSKYVLAILMVSASSSLLCSCNKVGARQVDVDEGPVTLSSDSGLEMLRSSDGLRSFAMLIATFETQANLAYCGVASSVAALNAIGRERPVSPEHGTYRLYTQSNFFDAATDAVLSEDKVRRSGMTLAELGSALAAHKADVKVSHADEATIDGFRSKARAILSSASGVILINYYRPAVGQQGGGHISPVAAYDAHTDRFLILDVARFKLPPVWVRAVALWAAMKAVDEESGRSRGWVIVQSAPS